MGAPEGAPGAQPAGSGRDLEQVRDAVDGARALLEILERRIPGELGPLRDALSRLQMAYAREMQSTVPPAQPPGAAPEQAAQEAPAQAQQPPKSPEDPSGPGPAQQPPKPAEDPSGPGPAEASGRLWVPGR
jgi:hypothetical protein